MNRFFILCTFVLLCICSSSYGHYSPALLPSTEGDPEGFVEQCVCVINGDYCESETDIAIAGPDTLLLQRFFSTKNYLTGEGVGGWRIFPQQFLVLGEEKDNPLSDGLRRIRAFTGERSGGILSYSGLTPIDSFDHDLLRIDLLNDGIGMVNTYAKEINGQTNHQNNHLFYQGNTCEIVLGDGTRRLYQKVNRLPHLIFGEELIPHLANEITAPEYFSLIRETLPSGNNLLFSYDSERHLSRIEMKNSSLEKSLSWLSFTYKEQENGYIVRVASSDEKILEYNFSIFTINDGSSIYVLTEVNGSHLIPCSYSYKTENQYCLLVKKILPEGRFLEVDYETHGKVASLKFPHPISGEAFEAYTFGYGNGFTDVCDTMGVKTSYLFDSRNQLKAIEKYNGQGELYRIDRKLWGTQKENIGLLIGKIIADGHGLNKSYCNYGYDSYGNVLEKKLYGNLSGKEEISLNFTSENQLLNADKLEFQTALYTYSSDGFNLLMRSGDTSLINTVYSYKAGTNLCEKELLKEGKKIKKRIFRLYNNDASLVKSIVDDGHSEDENSFIGVSERQITEITPIQSLPCVGLAKIVEERVLDVQSQSELLSKRTLNIFDSQGNLLWIETYDSNNQFACREARTYNNQGLINSETDLIGRQTFYTYDANGNRLSTSSLHDGKLIEYFYDFSNQLTRTAETIGAHVKITGNIYDIKGRKVASTDIFGNTTHYAYDDFGRLTEVSFPTVLNEKRELIQPTFKYQYDIFGNVVSETDACGYTTTKTYNILGSPSRIIYPDGTNEVFKYHLSGVLHRALSKDGIMTFFEYDALGRTLTKHSSFPTERQPGVFLNMQTWDYKGFRCSTTTDRHLAINYQYDSFGRPIQILKNEDKGNPDDPNAHKTELYYDGLGRVSQKKIWFDVGPQDFYLENYIYDLTGNILEKQMIDADGVVLLQRNFDYDSCGRCIEEFILSEGKRETLIKTAYNQLGEPIAYIDASGNVTNIHIDHAYTNGIGQEVTKKTIIAPLGAHTEIEFDALSRVVCVTKKDPMGSILSHHSLIYDACGNKCLEIQDQIVDGICKGENVSRWIYGPMGCIEEEIEACGTDEEIHTKYAYNQLGQLKSKSVTGSSVPLKFTYGWNGKLEQIDHADKTQQQIQEVSYKYQYNDRGNIVRAQDLLNRVTIDRKYDIFEQLVSESVQADFKNYTVEYSYDRKGRARQVKLPDNSFIEYIYGPIFGKEVRRLSPDKEILYSHLYDDHDEHGRLISEQLIGNMGNRKHEYSSNNLVKQVKIESLGFEEKAERDELGRIVKLEQYGPQGRSSKHFSYNNLSQLNLEKANIDYSYTYDSLDNRLSKNTDEMAYKALFQLQSYSDTQLTHTLDGNLATKSTSQNKLTFLSNALSEILQIDSSDQKRLSYLNDPFGRCLIRKLIDSKTKKTLSTEILLYLGDQEIGSLDEKNNIQQLRIPGIDGEQLSDQSISLELNGRYYAPLHGLDSNLIALADPQSLDIVESYTYTAYGEETIYDSYGMPSQESKLNNPWRYKEKRKDPTTGLLLFGVRQYDPEVGRWITPDPLGAHDGPNPYAYVRNNPLNNMDRVGFGTENVTRGTLEHYFHDGKEVYSRCTGEPWNRYCVIVRYPVTDGCKGNQLPRVTYNDNFEKMMGRLAVPPPHYRPSHIYNLNLPEARDLRIGFINGVNNRFSEALETTHYISRLAGGYNVHAVYNATHGLRFDFIECDMGLNNYIATEPVRQLHNMWNEFFNQASPEGMFLQICHSQGAIHVRNALLDYPEELRDRIIVVAIAPGGYIYQQTCANVTHYRADAYRDPIPRIDRAGAQRSKETIVDLESHPNAPLLDHTILSSTYKKALIYVIENYFMGVYK